MKHLIELPISILCFIVLVSCTTDDPSTPQLPTNAGVNRVVKTDSSLTKQTNLYFGFLKGGGSSNTYIDKPIESSPTDLIVGRWSITKMGVDENNDGNVKYYGYEDQDCGLSFLQFNNDGVVFENTYYKNNGTCTLYSEIDDWELTEANRIKISDYNNIYLVDVTESVLVLKYDWNFENSLYGPTQVYYYFERN